jgi:uncharacterized protein (TIGR03435 family)
MAGQVEAIMRDDTGRKRKTWKRLLLATVSVATIAAPVTVGVLTPPPLRAQSRAVDATPPQTFEVASIKSNKSLEGRRGAGFQPGGRFLARNMPLRSLIAIAYGEPRPLPDFQISGGPDWIDADRFDVEAKAQGNFPETQTEAGFSTSGELMLQALLVERFKLAAHRETRQLPIYGLTTARSDGKLGPQLRPSSGADCANAPTRGATAVPDPNALPRCGVFQFVGATAGNLRHARIRFVTMDQIAKNLEISLNLGRVVLNRTGLAGTFSLDLEFTAVSPTGSPDAAGANDSAASIFTALQEQLGLKLEATRGPVDVIVIDSAQHPTPD